MARSIGDLISEADEILAMKYGTVKTAEPQDDIYKLASELKKVSSEDGLVDDNLSVTEKIAHAVALVDTLLNLEEMKKIADFEKKAQEAGFPEDKVASFFEKRAAVKFRSVLDMI